jgi:hypothetical protein
MRNTTTTTTNLSDFGYRELKMVRDLLDAMITDGLPENFHNEGVTPMFNMTTGFVFLTNNTFQVAMINGDKLEMYYTCPECGEEGFEEEIEYSPNDCCEEYLKHLQ